MRHNSAYKLELTKACFVKQKTINFKEAITYK